MSDDDVILPDEPLEDDLDLDADGVKKNALPPKDLIDDDDTVSLEDEIDEELEEDEEDKFDDEDLI